MITNRVLNLFFTWRWSHHQTTGIEPFNTFWYDTRSAGIRFRWKISIVWRFFVSVRNGENFQIFMLKSKCSQGTQPKIKNVIFWENPFQVLQNESTSKLVFFQFRMYTSCFRNSYHVKFKYWIGHVYSFPLWSYSKYLFKFSWVTEDFSLRIL